MFLSEEPPLTLDFTCPVTALSPAAPRPLSGPVNSWTRASPGALAGAASAGVLCLFVCNVCASQSSVKWSSLAEELTVRASFQSPFYFR